MEPIILRAVERLIGVMIGGLAIYLGYRLFLALPKRTDSSGRVILPGGVNIFLSRIGPGGFFALFGAGLVAFSLRSAVEAELRADAGRSATTQPAADAEPAPAFRYIGAGEQGGKAANLDLSAARAEVLLTIDTLNKLPSKLPENLSAEWRTDIDDALHKSKLALIQSVWGKEWGDFATFRQWINEGEKPPVPEQFNAPRGMYHKGETP